MSKHEFNNTFDITKTTFEQITKNIDIFTYSFPCQDLSNQGKQKGMKKNSNTRSSLLWEIERIFQEMKDNWKNSEMPKYLLLENVSQVGNYKNINSLNKWIKKLDELGYETRMYYLNSSNFNSPQNRLRAFGLSVRKDWKRKVKFEFQDLETIYQENKKPIKEILDSRPNKKDLMNDLLKYKREEFKLTNSNIMKSKLIGYTNFSSESYIYDPNFTGPTLTASGANSRIKLYDNKKIRKMNAREAIKYMGFSDVDYELIAETNLPENKIIYLAGNSISIEVLEKIFESLRF